MSSIELLSRGALTHDGKLLLTYNKKKKHMFLPGGHIEFGESAIAALIREIQEETGMTVKVNEFLAAVEHQWQGTKHQHCELNLIFHVMSTALSSRKAPESREPNIEFLWHPLNELSSINLQPAILRKELPKWLDEGSTSIWGSAYP